MDVGTFCPHKYKSFALHAHPTEPRTRTINLLVGVKYKTPIIGAPGRGLARSATRFSKFRMVEIDVGVARAPGATERFGNSLDNEETMNRASEATTPETSESPNIIGSLRHLRLDPLEGGSMQPGSPQPIFSKALEVSSPVHGPSSSFPCQGREADVGPCSRMLYIKNKATQLLTIRDLHPSKHYFPWDIMIFRRRS
jgi:hypothetical protein